MSLKIREATPEDAGGITDVHCSDVEKWFKIEGDKIIPSEYELLHQKLMDYPEDWKPGYIR